MFTENIQLPRRNKRFKSVQHLATCYVMLKVSIIVTQVCIFQVMKEKNPRIRFV